MSDKPTQSDQQGDQSNKEALKQRKWVDEYGQPLFYTPTIRAQPPLGLKKKLVVIQSPDEADEVRKAPKANKANKRRNQV